MDNFFVLIAGEITVGVYAVLTTFRRNRRRRTIICPQTTQIAEMEIKAGHARAMTAIRTQDLRVKWCSLWPPRKGCSEDCLLNDWHFSLEQQLKDSDDDKLADAAK